MASSTKPPYNLAAMAFLIAGPALWGNPAAAQSGHAHAAPNGGQVQQIGAYEAELVLKNGELSLYVLDNKEAKVPSGKLSAVAVVLAKGNQPKNVDMMPAGDNRLSAKIDFPFEGKFRATVTLKTEAGEAGKGRYSLDGLK